MYIGTNVIVALVAKKLAVPVVMLGVASGLVSGSISSLPQPAQAEVIPTPTPITVSVPSPAPPEVTDPFDRYFGHLAVIARAIAKAENPTGQADLVHTNRDYGSLPDKPWKRFFMNGSEDYGIMQINLFWNWARVPGETKREKAAWIVDPVNNISLAKEIRDDWGNFNAWTTYRSGKYKNYLERN
jgi:hypothetical protein